MKSYSQKENQLLKGEIKNNKKIIETIGSYTIIVVHGAILLT